MREGRAAFLAQFPSIATPQVMAALPDPTAMETFERCTLDFEERRNHESIYLMHHDLLQLRREDPVLSAQQPRGLDGAVLGPEAFVLRFFGEGGSDRLLVVNFGGDITYNPAPEPLLAPPPTRSGESSGRVTRCATVAQGSPTSKRVGTGAFLGTPRSSSRRSRRRG